MIGRPSQAASRSAMPVGQPDRSPNMFHAPKLIRSSQQPPRVIITFSKSELSIFSTSNFFTFFRSPQKNTSNPKFLVYIFTVNTFFFILLMLRPSIRDSFRRACYTPHHVTQAIKIFSLFTFRFLTHSAHRTAQLHEQIQPFMYTPYNSLLVDCVLQCRIYSVECTPQTSPLTAILRHIARPQVHGPRESLFLKFYFSYEPE